MRKNLFALVVVCFSLAACDRGGGGGAETINGIAVPPAPDPAANRATLSGIDSNSNGIRDDIERLVAEVFGANPGNFAEATNYARTEQAAITSPTPTAITQHLALVSCVTDSQKLSDLGRITTTTLDTPERQAAYGAAFAGAILSSEGCTP